MPLGRRVLISVFKCKFDSFLEEAFISFGLGIGLIGLMILYIGLIGLLYKWLIVAILALLSLVLMKDIRYIIGKTFGFFKSIPNLHLNSFEKILLIFIVFIWFFTLIGSLSPILGMDALSYHVRDPKLFIEAHKVIPIPHTRDSLWPFLMQMLFTLGLILKSEVLSKLFHFGFGIFSITGLYCLCRRYWSRQNALFTSCVFALIPVIFTVTTYAYTELVSVFYTISIFYLFFVWLDKKDMRWLCLSAVFCGFLMGIKITSAPVIVILLCLYLFNIMRERKGIRKISFSVIMFTVIFIATCGVWYIRSWLILGNPIFPFAAYIFGYGYPEDQLRYHLIAGLGLSPISYIRMLWPLTHYPDIFGGESIGPIFLIFLPMLIFLRRPPRFIKYILFIALAMYTAWFFTFQYTRFFSSTLPFLSILISYIIFDICKRDRIIYRVSGLAVILIFIYSAALSVYHNIDKVPVAFGFEGRKDYLVKHERSYVMAEYINENLPEDSRLLVISEPRLFYYNRHTDLAISVKLNMLYDRNIRYKGNFEDYLRYLNFDYILYVEDRSPQSNIEPYFTPKTILIKEKKELIKEINFNHKGEIYIYQLWKIKKPFRKTA
jgi:hypothetical protein